MTRQASFLSKKLYSNGKDSFNTNVVDVIKQFCPDVEDIDVEAFVLNTNINDFNKTIKAEKYILIWKKLIENLAKVLSLC